VNSHAVDESKALTWIRDLYDYTRRLGIED